jgi:gamma-glutamylcyclotransferase (GGCT)/AIG2-like uncharacterized protein YtfP
VGGEGLVLPAHIFTIKLMYYFAYGSNMDLKQMKERCSSATLLGSAILNNYKIAFTIFSPLRKCGCADIVKSVGSTVPGLVYEISDADMIRLDNFEGHPIHYRRFSISVKMTDGADINCETYEVNKKSEAIAPSKNYLGIMLSAAETYKFPSTYTDQLRAIQTCD